MLNLPSEVTAFILLVFLLGAGAIVYVFVSNIKSKGSQLRDLDEGIAELRRRLGLYEAGNANIIDSLMSIEQTILMHRAILDEVTNIETPQMERARELLYAQRKQVMRLIHHSGLAHLDDSRALESSWALATEFGESETIQRMIGLEGYRKPANLKTFQEHREILTRRLRAEGKLS
jgi:hypothetical protein